MAGGGTMTRCESILRLRVAATILSATIAAASYGQQVDGTQRTRAATKAPQVSAAGAAQRAVSGGVMSTTRNGAASARGVVGAAGGAGMGGAMSAFFIDTGRYPTTAEGL